MEHTEILIIGAGAAGMSAASGAYDAGCRDITLADSSPVLGGVLPQCLHYGFGLTTYGEELTGPEYARRLAKKLPETGVKILLGHSVLRLSPDRIALLSGREGLISLSFDKLILATGCREIPIGALPVAGTRPAGIFTAGEAQELINLRGRKLGRRALIIGSGDLGMIIARRFALEGGQVAAVIEKNEVFGGMARNYHRCIEATGIPLICSARVTEIFGSSRVTGAAIRHLHTGESERIECDTLITAVGLVPERSLAEELDAPGWLYFCGNCSRVHDIVDSASAEAYKVGRAAAENCKD